jgi:hypothetical protein
MNEEYPGKGGMSWNGIKWINLRTGEIFRIMDNSQTGQVLTNGYFPFVRKSKDSSLRFPMQVFLKNIASGEEELLLSKSIDAPYFPKISPDNKRVIVFEDPKNTDKSPLDWHPIFFDYLVKLNYVNTEADSLELITPTGHYIYDFESVEFSKKEDKIYFECIDPNAIRSFCSYSFSSRKFEILFKSSNYLGRYLLDEDNKEVYVAEYDADFENPAQMICYNYLDKTKKLIMESENGFQDLIFMDNSNKILFKNYHDVYLMNRDGSDIEKLIDSDKYGDYNSYDSQWAKYDEETIYCFYQYDKSWYNPHHYLTHFGLFNIKKRDFKKIGK